MKSDLKQIILKHGPLLTKKASWLDGVAALGALAEIESSFGEFNIPKYERAYDVTGKYFNRELWLKWGAWAACSYSSWQIMYPVTVELGFSGTPIQLMDDEIAVLWVLEYIDKRILARGCNNLKHFADAYNSGSFRDANIPETYINRFLGAYSTIVARRFS